MTSFDIILARSSDDDWSKVVFGISVAVIWGLGALVSGHAGGHRPDLLAARQVGAVRPAVQLFVVQDDAVSGEGREAGPRWLADARAAVATLPRPACVISSGPKAFVCSALTMCSRRIVRTETPSSG